MAGQQEKTMKITIDRSTVEQALKALSLALSDVDWRAKSPTQPVIHKAHTALKAALAGPVQEPVPDRLEQLRAFCKWERVNSPHPDGLPHVAEWALREIDRLRAAKAQPVQDTDCHAQGICQRSGYSIK
jgi:hypothetical protein